MLTSHLFATRYGYNLYHYADKIEALYQQARGDIAAISHLVYVAKSIHKFGEPRVSDEIFHRGIQLHRINALIHLLEDKNGK